MLTSPWAALNAPASERWPVSHSLVAPALATVLPLFLPGGLVGTSSLLEHLSLPSRSRALATRPLEVGRKHMVS